MLMIDHVRTSWIPWSIALFCFISTVLSTGGPSVELLPLLTTFNGETSAGFAATVQFGSPLQKLPVLLDGGLDFLYFFSPNCTDRGCGAEFFFPSESSSLSYTDRPINYTYAAGNLNVLGEVVVDQGKVAGLSDFNQSFGLINSVSEPLYYPTGVAVAGVFGFAYPNSEFADLALIPQLCESNQIPTLIGLWLPPNVYDSGVLSFGEPDSDLYVGPINYVPLLPSTWAKKNYNFFWSNVISDIKINGVSNGYCKRRTCNFFLDLAARPMDLANAIPKVPIASDCSNIDQLDTYTFTINNIDYTLTPDQYVIRLVDDYDQITCESGIYGGAKIPYPFTLGYTWIHNFYTVLDFDNLRFGFATAA